MNGKKLILPHLLTTPSLLFSSDLEGQGEVLPIFPEDAAGTVAITIVSCFSENGTKPDLTSPFAFDWAVQAVGYCLSLPTLFHQPLEHSMRIIRNWLYSDNLQKDKNRWNSYARRFFEYLSLIFDYSQDRKDSTQRKKLIHILLKDLGGVQNDLKSCFDQDTWSVLIRVLIGAADYLINAKSDKVQWNISNEDREKLCRKCLSVMFQTLNTSRLKSTEIWEIFTSFCKKWSKEKEFLEAWSKKVKEIYKNFLKKLYDKDETDDNRNWMGFHLYQYIHCVDFDEIAKTIQNFEKIAGLVDDLYKQSNELVENSQNLYKPLITASHFFGLFGEWCFKPFSTEQSHNSIMIKTLSNIARNWYVDDGWAKVILSSIVKTIDVSIKKESKNLMPTILKNGHDLMMKFISDDLITQFSKIVETLESGQYTSFWGPYSLLLCDIAERRALNEKVILKFAENSYDIGSTTNVLSILLWQNSELFFDIILKFIDKTLKFPPNTSQTEIEQLSILYIIAASSPPFIKLKNMDLFIPKLIDCSSYHMNSPKLIQSFLILIASLARWDDFLFKSKLSVKVIDFLVQFKEFLTTVYNDKPEDYFNDPQLHSLFLNVSRTLCGRAVDRSIQAVDTSKTLATFMIGDASLVSVYGEKSNEVKRDDSFILHVRNPSGFFIWELSDYLDKGSLETPQEISEHLPEPPKIPENYININYKSKFPEIEKVINQIANVNTLDPDYQHSSMHTLKSHISIFSDESIRLRHKAIDFLIQTQISKDVRTINENISDVIKKFDEIPAVSIVYVPLFHFDSNGPSQNDTPIFKRFSALLTPIVKMGLVDIYFSPNDNKNNFIGILFNECPLTLNIEHKLIPKCELLFIVTPFDPAFYKVLCISSHLEFKCSVSEERMVSTCNLTGTILMAIFQFIGAVKPSIFFEMNEKREKLLKEIQTSPTRSLDLVKSYELDVFN